jgi:hypothetical protein
MGKRKKFSYTVTLQAQSGEIIEHEIKNYWSPAYEGIKEAIGSCAASLLWLKSGKKLTFEVISVAVPS